MTGIAAVRFTLHRGSRRYALPKDRLERSQIWTFVDDDAFSMPAVRGFIRANARIAVQPRRWVVERFFAWINRNRRLWKDAEATIASATAFLYAAAAMVLIRRIARTS